MSVTPLLRQASVQLHAPWKVNNMTSLHCKKCGQNKGLKLKAPSGMDFLVTQECQWLSGILRHAWQGLEVWSCTRTRCLSAVCLLSPLSTMSCSCFACRTRHVQAVSRYKDCAARELAGLHSSLSAYCRHHCPPPLPTAAMFAEQQSLAIHC